MPFTALTVQKVAITGVVPTYAAADGVNGNSFLNGSGVFLHVKNGGGSSINVTLDTPGKVGGVDISNPVVAVANGSEKMIGPFSPEAFNQSDGKVNVTFSSATSVTVAAIQI